MMTKAIIIFADGSKQMAHNMDDQKFRWYERKRAEFEEIKKLAKTGIIIRACNHPSSINQANEWRTELKLQHSELSQQIAILKAKFRGNFAGDDYAIHSKGTKIALLQVETELTHINRYIESVRIDTVDNENQVLKQKLFDAQSEIIRLQRLLIDQFNLPEDMVIQSNSYDSNGNNSGS